MLAYCKYCYITYSSRYLLGNVVMTVGSPLYKQIIFSHVRAGNSNSTRLFVDNSYVCLGNRVLRFRYE